MSGQARRIGENVINQQLRIAIAQLEAMHVALMALISYFGPLPEDLDVQIQAVLASPDMRKKPQQELLNAISATVSDYKRVKGIIT